MARMVRPEEISDEKLDELLSDMKSAPVENTETPEEKTESVEEDKTEERFRGINEHTPMPGMETSWLSKVVGDT